MKPLVGLVAVALVAGCHKRTHYDNLDHAKAKGVFDELPLPDDVPPGLSGLALDDNGTLWAVPERDRFVVEIARTGLTATTKLHPLVGVPDGVDTEGLAYLGDNKLAIGTEGQHDPTAAVLYAHRDGDRFVVDQTRELTSKELGVDLAVNKGAEGACGRGDDVLVAIETVGTLPGGVRWAPLARLTNGTLTVSRIKLTSDVGKISSLDCAIAPDGTATGYMIERHFGVSRILRFQAKPGDVDITPTIALDLSSILNDSLNLEGIVLDRDGRLVAVVDNQGAAEGATIDAPNELLVFGPGVGTH